MAYIEVRTNLPGHRKVKIAARELGISRHQLIGHLVCLWTWSLDNVPSDGDLDGLTDVDLEAAAEWPEERAGALVAALAKAGFIDVDATGRYIHDWEQYAGRLLKRREQNRERQRAHREQLRREKAQQRGGPVTRDNGTSHAPAADPPNPQPDGGKPRKRDKAAGNGTQQGRSRVTPRSRHAPTRAPARARTVTDTVEESQRDSPRPPSMRRRRQQAPGDRPDLQAYADRGWRWTEAQADDLRELAWQLEISAERGLAVLAEWIRTAPTDVPDLHRYILDLGNRTKAERVAKADADEAAWQETKRIHAGEAADTVQELADRLAPKPNGHPRVDRDRALSLVVEAWPQLDDAGRGALLTRYQLTERDVQEALDAHP